MGRERRLRTLTAHPFAAGFYQLSFLLGFARIVVPDAIDFVKETTVGALALLVVHVVPEAFLTYLHVTYITVSIPPVSCHSHLPCICSCKGRILSRVHSVLPCTACTGLGRLSAATGHL